MTDRINHIKSFLKQPPALRDAVILCLFTIAITYQPFILYEEILPGELGIYLPSIQAALNGLVPYRDFFYLRGPLEIYIPALFMKLFSESIPVLYYFFYAGTVLCYLILICMGRYLYQTRLFYYLMVPVAVALTFPYVEYYIWGGMRYAFGLIVLTIFIFYFEDRSKVNKQESQNGIVNKYSKTWLIYAGAFSSVAAFLTATDVGIAAIFGIIFGLIVARCFNTLPSREFLKCLGHYLTGLILFFSLYGSYLLWTGSLNAYLDNIYSVAKNITKVFDTPQRNKYPATISEWLWSFLPMAKNFKHMTPVYCYVFFFGYALYLYRRKQLTPIYNAYFCIATYGFLLYCLAWRIIECAQFEMALMVEKLLLFFLLERLFFILNRKKNVILKDFGGWRFRREKLKSSLVLYGVTSLFVILVLTSWGYATSRFNKRFDAFKVAQNFLLGQDNRSLQFSPDEPKDQLDLPKMKGLVVPQNDAKFYKEITRLTQILTEPDEPVMFFPEDGMYNFIVDRPFVGRFAMVDFAWFSDHWQKELMQNIKEQRPSIIVVQDPISQRWIESRVLHSKANTEKFNETYNYIQRNYHIIHKIGKFAFYQIKG